MRRWLFLLMLLPNCTSCLYYAYPTLIYTPEQPIDNRDGSAHAFRVDIDRTERKPAPTATQYTLSRIPLDARGLVPSQLEVAPKSGVWNPLGVTESAQHEFSDYTMAVRMYRPGYQTKEIKAWDKARDPQWLKADNLAAQEKAIDDLLAGPSEYPNFNLDGKTYSPVGGDWWALKDQKTPPFGLQPGAASKSQRDALLFASGEYQRLANSPLAMSPNVQTARERLVSKAIWLRKYAEQGQ